MKSNRFTGCRLRDITRGIFVTAFVLSLFTCAFPGVKESPIKPDEVKDFVDKHYDDFKITYSGEKESPTAIVFDPRNDDVTLKGDGWYPVESKPQVLDIISDMISRYRFFPYYYDGPYLFEIQSEKGRIIGYCYSVHGNLTLWRDGNNYRLNPITESDNRDERKIYSIKGAGHS